MSDGYRTLWLGVWENNHRAQAFYRKWKFHEVGTHIFQLGQDAQTDLLMERSLDVSANCDKMPKETVQRDS